MVPKPLPDMGPVFLFYMSVIVLMIGSASGKVHGFISLVKVLDQMPIQELRTIVAVKPKQRKRQGVFDIVDLPEDLCFAFTPDRSLFCPAGSSTAGFERDKEFFLKSRLFKTVHPYNLSSRNRIILVEVFVQN